MWKSPVPVTVDATPQVPPRIVNVTGMVRLSDAPYAFARLGELGAAERAASGAMGPGSVQAVSVRAVKSSRALDRGETDMATPGAG